MRMLRHKRERGMVMVVVTAAIMMMTILIIGMLGRYASRTMGGENEIKRMQAELLAKGAFWHAYQGSGTASTLPVTVGGTTYTVTYANVNGAGPGGTAQVTMNVSY